MPKEHPAIRLDKQRASLKRLETKAKRLGTLIASRKRSIRALERSVAKAGPAPPPEPEAPKPAATPDPDAGLLARFQAAAERYARTLGVAKPRARIAGPVGPGDWDHCKRARRAHCHTNTVWWRTGTTGLRWGARGTMIPRGTICLNRNYLRTVAERTNGVEELAAHEVSHLTRSTKKRGYGNSHGRGFYENMAKALGVTPERARGIDVAGGFDLDDNAEPVPIERLVKQPDLPLRKCDYCGAVMFCTQEFFNEHVATRHADAAGLVKVPRLFYDDHNSRDLPAPDPVHEDKRYVWLPRVHPDMAELINDAEHYAWSGWTKDDEGMMRYSAAAKRLLAVLKPSEAVAEA